MPARRKLLDLVGSHAVEVIGHRDLPGEETQPLSMD